MVAAVTTEPAKILGLSDRVGSLKAGADANIVLYDGDPLSMRSQVQHVFIDGKQVYDRSKDPRLKHLFEGKQPKGTQADPDGAAEDEKKDDDKDDSDDSDE